MHYMISPLLINLVEKGILIITQFKETDLTARKNNALLIGEVFWETHSSFDKMVVFQSDSCICPSSPFELHDFSILTIPERIGVEAARSV